MKPPTSQLRRVLFGSLQQAHPEQATAVLRREVENIEKTRERTPIPDMRFHEVQHIADHQALITHHEAVELPAVCQGAVRRKVHVERLFLPRNRHLFPVVLPVDTEVAPTVEPPFNGKGNGHTTPFSDRMKAEG